MTREETLAKLKTLRFTALWPGDWEDIGFTERPIWVNSLGYGYYACDEPCGFTIIDDVSDDDIKDLKQKIINKTLSIDDVKESPFYEINIYNDDDFLDYVIEDFLQLPNHTDGQIFCGLDMEGWSFYTSEEELIEAFDRKNEFNGGEPWDNLDDELLEIWCERLSNIDGLYVELPMTLSIFR